jgi:hypothetical protein
MKLEFFRVLLRRHLRKSRRSIRHANSSKRRAVDRQPDGDLRARPQKQAG